ncbi:hypothetical protein CDV31_013472 [Fusarium ambrosium]|uniref:D domain-containing protein n=1 Tax=Fusarium ambrosium TaxID=131363 RepID=A0A428T3D0_9HYPO|nr:hypothetical protein CDV31_013472 [Fusarium ambrosium]
MSSFLSRPSPISTLEQRHSTFSMKRPQPSDNDRQRARELMSEYQAETNQRVGDGFTYKDANGVLDKIAQGIILNVTPALVDTLFAYNANVSIRRFKSTSWWKVVIRKDQDDVRSHVLKQAISTCSDEVVLRLAENADMASINDAIPIAISRGDTFKTYILLQRGGDVSGLCDQFQMAVESGSDEMVYTLLSHGQGVCQDCRNRGLVKAATLGFGVKVHSLLRNKADVSFDNASALLSAIRHRNQSIAEAIASHKDMSKYPLLLDTAVGEAYGQRQYLLLQSLVDAGAKGPKTDETLAKAIEDNQLTVARTLVRGGASMTGEGQDWLQSTVRGGRPELLQIALQSKPSHDILAATISHAAKLPDLEISHQMIALLLDAGVRGESVCDSLVQVLSRSLQPHQERSQMALIKLLLQQGQANINLRGGRCVTLVISQGRVDLLGLMLQYNPSFDTLVVALGAAMELVIPDLRREVIDVIFHDKSGTLRFDHAGREVLQQAAVIAAAKSIRLDVLQSLITAETPAATFSAALTGLVTGNQKWLTSEGLTVVQVLLEHGASGPTVDNAFCQAVTAVDEQAINLLIDFVSNTAFDRALMSLVKHSEAWKEESQLELVERLLVRVCHGQTVNDFLVEAVTACAAGKASQDLIETIISVSEGVANVNYNLGEPLKRAVVGGDISLLKKLLEFGALAEALTQAFMAIITTTLEEATTLELLETLMTYKEQSGEGFDVQGISIGHLPPLAACLAAHPKSPRLIKRLIKLGCNTETTFLARLGNEKIAEPESVTVLLWALYPREDREISTEVILELISTKENASFASSSTKTTPLIMASRHNRSHVVQTLIKAGADPNTRDRFSTTPLFYASRLGHAETVQQLVKAKPRKNDGSLHEAARNLHIKVIEILIEAGHEANYRSTRREHEGRTAIQELTSKGDGSRDLEVLEAAILALEGGKADLLSQHGGKNALFLAMENLEPYGMTAALLNASMWREMASERNVFASDDPSTGMKYYYSPTMYLHKGCYTGKSPNVTKLLGLFEQLQCPDRFYAEPAPGQLKFRQPPDAVGMPKKLREAEDKRKADEEKEMARDREHQNKMRRDREEANLKRELTDFSHQQKMAQSEASHQTKIMQNGQVSNQAQAQAAQRLHNAQQHNKESLAYQMNKNNLAEDAMRVKNYYRG